jgi:hypothetical protein
MFVEVDTWYYINIEGTQGDGSIFKSPSNHMFNEVIQVAYMPH